MPVPAGTAWWPVTALSRRDMRRRLQLCEGWKAQALPSVIAYPNRIRAKGRSLFGARNIGPQEEGNLHKQP
jgi:hypothetical protein